MKNEIKKGKTKKNIAILLIILPLIIVISYLGKANFDKYGVNNYIISGALIILIIIGFIGLKNSLRRLKG